VLQPCVATTCVALGVARSAHHRTVDEIHSHRPRARSESAPAPEVASEFHRRNIPNFSGGRQHLTHVLPAPHGLFALVEEIQLRHRIPY
jgi:hypothetical protein